MVFEPLFLSHRIYLQAEALVKQCDALGLDKDPGSDAVRAALEDSKHAQKRYAAMKIQKAFCVVLTIPGKKDWPPAAKSAASKCLENLEADPLLAYHPVMVEMVATKAGASASEHLQKLKDRDGPAGRPLPPAKRARTASPLGPAAAAAAAAAVP